MAKNNGDAKDLDIPISSPVINYYNGKSIFITGCTGFLGMVLLEKLLYTCEGIKNVYILIKPKHEQTMEERLSKSLSSEAFQRLRKRNPDFFKKVKPIAGDITEKSIGICSEDIKLLQDEVSVVFHSAASISFHMSIADAINTNTRATEELLEISKKMRNLTAFVYVSTAYSNCNKPVSDEKVYEMDVSLERVCDFLQFSTSESINELLLDGRPNSYTYSKALAEQIIVKSSNSIPCVIVRPSIILSSVRDPEPGWIQGWNGLCSVVYSGMNGYLKTSRANDSLVLDVIPVDYTANLIIVSAWEISKTRYMNGNIFIRTKEGNNLKVFNCCTGAQNPITSGQIIKTSMEHNKKCENRNSRANTLLLYILNTYLYNIAHFFLDIIPAILYDFACFFVGKKMQAYKTVKKFRKLVDVLTYFSTNQFLFLDNNVRKLYKSLDDHDKKIFDFDVKNIHWDNYLKDYIKGLNKMCNKR